MSDTQQKLKKFIGEKFRQKYSPESILPYDDNKIIHKLMTGNPLFDSNEIPNLKIMNPNITAMSRQLLSSVDSSRNMEPESFTNKITETLLDELDIRPTKEDMIAIREKNIKLCIIGTGGAMINVLYNMLIWSKSLSEIGIFDKLVIFEKDVLDVGNIPRIGKPIVTTLHTDLTLDWSPDVDNTKLLPKIDLLSDEHLLVRGQKPVIFKEWVEQKEIDILSEKEYTFVGAPTLDTRAMLHETDFYFIGHGDTEVEIRFQPQMTSGLVVETYGVIDIPVLLINLQLATAAFIKQLAGGLTQEQNEALFTFDLKTRLEEGWIDV